jgi:hypothetical protein
MYETQVIMDHLKTSPKSFVWYMSVPVLQQTCLLPRHTSSLFWNMFTLCKNYLCPPSQCCHHMDVQCSLRLLSHRTLLSMRLQHGDDMVDTTQYVPRTLEVIDLGDMYCYSMNLSSEKGDTFVTWLVRID